MPVNYCYNAIDRVIEVVCSGELVIGGIQDYFAAIKRDAAIGDGAVEIVDLSRVRYFNVSFEEASGMPKDYEPAQAAKGIKGTILYGANDVNEGLAELIRTYFKITLPLHRFVVVNSKSEAKAEARRIQMQRGADGK